MTTRLTAIFHRLSLTRKLTAIGVVASTVSLVIAGAVLLAFDLRAEYHDEVREVSIIAKVVGINSTAALAFGDAQAAGETLSALRSNPHVIGAAIYLPDGRLLARFDRDASPAWVARATLEGEGLRYRGDFSVGELTVMAPILVHEERIGSVFLVTDLLELRYRSIQYVGCLSVMLGVGFAVAFMLSHRLQRIISAPLLRLTDVTRIVTRDHQLRRPGRATATTTRSAS